jgi:dTDP-4-amino-4,6-dideoxygalactose transaminase
VTDRQAASAEIIGGMFGLESLAARDKRPTRTSPAFLSASRVDLATARGAFSLLDEFLAPKTVWLPSYLCGVIVDSFSESNRRVRFYPIDKQLGCSDHRWLADVAAADMIVFIDYFGFALWAEVGAMARVRGAWVVEDACQAMLNDHFCEHAHYVIFSPRKFAGVPDGGILVAQAGAALPSGPLPIAPADWWRDSLAAYELRAEFDRRGGDRRWFDLFRATEVAAPQWPARMSELTARLLAHAIDYEARVKARRENYRVLASLLTEQALFPTLTTGVTPLGFPIALSERARVLGALFAEQIYPAVHWPIDGLVPHEFQASHELAAEIATLPCDHRYGRADMERMASIVQQEIAK